MTSIFGKEEEKFLKEIYQIERRGFWKGVATGVLIAVAIVILAGIVK